MSNALSPREIQQRMRAGESISDLVADSGMPVERIEAFAGPILAERKHITSAALSSPARKMGESANHRNLTDVAKEHLTQRGVDFDTVQWDACRLAPKKWIVKASYELGTRTHEAHFKFDQMGRFSVAVNDDARWLLGENPDIPEGETQRIQDPDTEPTVDFKEEFALVDAVGVESKQLTSENLEEAIVFSDESLSEADHLENLQELAEQVMSEDFDLTDPALPVSTNSDFDALYDMFNSMNEDSVEIHPDMSKVTPLFKHLPTSPDSPTPLESQDATQLDELSSDADYLDHSPIEEYLDAEEVAPIPVKTELHVISGPEPIPAEVSQAEAETKQDQTDYLATEVESPSWPVDDLHFELTPEGELKPQEVIFDPALPSTDPPTQLSLVDDSQVDCEGQSRGCTEAVSEPPKPDYSHAGDDFSADVNYNSDVDLHSDVGFHIADTFDEDSDTPSGDSDTRNANTSDGCAQNHNFDQQIHQPILNSDLDAEIQSDPLLSHQSEDDLDHKPKHGLPNSEAHKSHQSKSEKSKSDKSKHRKSGRKKRASLPSWDEILFGAQAQRPPR